MYTVAVIFSHQGSELKSVLQRRNRISLFQIFLFCSSFVSQRDAVKVDCDLNLNILRFPDHKDLEFN